MSFPESIVVNCKIEIIIELQEELIITTFNVIAEVSNSLKQLVWNGIKGTSLGSDVGIDGITFAAPTDQSSGKLSIFLYRISENEFHRNSLPSRANYNEWIYPPLTLDLFYMITPHFDSGIKDRALKDHLLIGRVLQIFNENHQLQIPSLGDALAGEEIKLFNDNLDLNNINKIWEGIFDAKPYMLSIFYEVSPVRIDSTSRMAIKRTVKTIIDATDKAGIIQDD